MLECIWPKSLSQRRYFIKPVSYVCKLNRILWILVLNFFKKNIKGIFSPVGLRPIKVIILPTSFLSRVSYAFDIILCFYVLFFVLNFNTPHWDCSCETPLSLLKMPLLSVECIFCFYLHLLLLELNLHSKRSLFLKSTSVPSPYCSPENIPFCLWQVQKQMSS